MPQNNLGWLLGLKAPGVLAVAGLAAAILGWMGSNGFIDGIVHISAFDRLKWQVEEGARRNEEAHVRLNSDMGEIKSGVSKIIEAQRQQGEAIARIEASRK